MEHKKTLLTLAIAAMILTGLCVAPVVGVAPFFVVGGVELTLETGIAIAGILGLAAVKEDLKHHQDEYHEYLQKVYDSFVSWFSSLNEWTRDDSKEAHMLFDIYNVLYSGTPIGTNGEKPEELKMYHEARVTNNGKNVDIKKEAMTKEEAINLLKHMKKGENRGIFSPNKYAARDLYEAITGKKPTVKPEIHGKVGQSGYYYHYHINGVHNSHIWIWFY